VCVDRGAMWMSGRETTAREPRDRGCSGSEIVEIRSLWLRARGGMLVCELVVLGVGSERCRVGAWRERGMRGFDAGGSRGEVSP